MKLSRALLCAVTIVCGTASAQESLFTNVASSFRTGPYSGLKVDPANAEHFVVTTSDGNVLTTRDAGSNVVEAQALSARQYFPMTLRGAPQPGIILSRRFGRGAHRLFVSQLNAGMAVTRWAPWMAYEDPSTEILDVAMAPPGGHGALAGPNGVFVSDERMTVWTRAMGYPRPKGNATVGLSVAIDPGNPNVIIAGTNDGVWISFNAGATFARHPDKKLMDENVRHILWDVKDPKTVFLLAGGTVYKSENRGQNFEVALSIENEINAVAQAEEGVYVAHGKGLQLYSSDGTKDLIKDEPVVGIVPMGDGGVLAATDTRLFLIDKGEKRALLNTQPGDPYIKLEGSAELAWLLSKYGIYRIGVKEKRKRERNHPAPRLLMSEADVEHAVIDHMRIGDPTKTRLNDRWYANFLPRVTVTTQQLVSNGTTIAHDWSIPGIPFRTYSVTSGLSCCGATDRDPEVLVMAYWDLAKFLFGPYGNISAPFGLVEAGLRTNRTKMLDEVRWRYREIRQLALQLRHPPEDKKVWLFWQMRIEEYAEYIDALSGKQVVDLSNMEDLDEDE